MISYWQTDPSGYLRHILVGLFFMCVYIISGKKEVLAICFLVAMLKELYDQQVKGLSELLDVALTVLPLFCLMCSNLLKQVYDNRFSQPQV